jgi:hypothetical protein
LNAKSQGLQMNETTYAISKREVHEASVNEYSKLENA